MTPLICALAMSIPQPDGFTGRAAFDRVVSRLAPLRDRPIGELIQAAAMELEGVPYVAQTLDQTPERESCTVTLDGLDCVTFFESALGLARMVKAGGATPEELMAHVTHTRYRGGVLDGYASRLHYTSDWIDDNEAKGVVKDMTSSLPGAVRQDRVINFMTQNPGSYAPIKANPGLIPVLQRHEAALSSRPFWFVPKAAAAEAQNSLQAGDIIGTVIDGAIDISHTGLIVERGGKLIFMHTSLTQKKVIVDRPLADYLASVKKTTGFVAARPQESAQSR